MRTHSLRVSIAVAFLYILLANGARAQAGPQSQAQIPPRPWPIRAVIIATFPSEFQLWAEREHLTEAIPVPGVTLNRSMPMLTTLCWAWSAARPSSTLPRP
jgi:purine nucleoside permease